MLKKLYMGERSQYPRWRDEKGNFVGLSRILRNGTRAFATGLCRVMLARRPRLPWISYDAISYFKSHLNKNSVVLEFGSGMSTIWYARHSAKVYSVEDNAEGGGRWYQQMSDQFDHLGITNVQYLLAKSKAEYINFGMHLNTKFDLIMVDGSFRSECVANSLNLLADGGFFYLDNSDKHSGPDGGDTREAERLLTDFANSNGFKTTYFTDFAPTQFFVQQGLLVQAAL